MVELIFGQDFLLDNPTGAVAVLTFTILGSVVDCPETAAGFADSDFHRFFVKRQILAEAVERKFFLQRFDENTAGPAAFCTFEAIAFQVDPDTEAFALFTDVNFHGFRIEFHETHSLSEISKFLGREVFRAIISSNKPIITATFRMMSSRRKRRRFFLDNEILRAADRILRTKKGLSPIFGLNPFFYPL